MCEVKVSLVAYTLVIGGLLTVGVENGTTFECSELNRIELTSVVKVAGGVWYAGNTYPPEEYYIDPVDRRYYSCICARRKCVYVCCYHVERTDCENSLSLRLNRTISNADGLQGLVEEVELRGNSDYWLIYADLPKLNFSDAHPLLISGHEGELIEDGSFAYGSKQYATRMYCVNPTNDSAPNVVIMETDEHLEVHRWHSFGMIVSLPFLIATLIVYALIPELRNVPGKSLMCYVFTLTASYILLILIKGDVVGNSSDWCTTVGYLCYLALLSCFFWLNTMAFDIYWTFGGHRRQSTSGGLFRLYCLYAFGIPLLFLAVALMADFGDVMQVEMQPGVGKGQCLFKGERLVSFLYLYLPMLILLTVNVFFFVCTAVKIWFVERATAAALQGESRRHGAYANERNRFGLYVRLFVVMGITWIFEFITWMLSSQHWLVYLTDICNCVTGVFIFFFFVLKRKVWLLLQQRFSGKTKKIKRTPPISSVSAPSAVTSVTQA